MRILVFILLILPLKSFAEKGFVEPWGRDAALSRKETVAFIPKATPSIMARVAQTVIAFRQNVLTKADGPRSHFRPTSSKYMELAIKRYGFLKGYLMGCDRLLRENSDKWIYPTVKIGKETYLFDPAFDDKKIR